MDIIIDKRNIRELAAWIESLEDCLGAIAASVERYFAEQDSASRRHMLSQLMLANRLWIDRPSDVLIELREDSIKPIKEG